MTADHTELEARVGEAMLQCLSAEGFPYNAFNQLTPINRQKLLVQVRAAIDAVIEYQIEHPIQLNGH